MRKSMPPVMRKARLAQKLTSIKARITYAQVFLHNPETNSLTLINLELVGRNILPEYQVKKRKTENRIMLYNTKLYLLCTNIKKPIAIQYDYRPNPYGFLLCSILSAVLCSARLPKR